MPASVTSISNPSPRRGGSGGNERAALEAAIRERARAADAVQAHRSAIARARSLVSLAERRLEKAARGIEEAKQENGRLMAEAIAAGDDDANGGAAIVRAARAMEVSGLDHVETARAALRRLQAQSANVDAALIEATNNIDVAINNLLTPVVRAALERARQLDAELNRHLALLRFMRELGHERSPQLPEDLSREIRMGRALDQSLLICEEISEYFNARPRAADELRNATRVRQQIREDLRQNPETLLPT